jgi:Flp pilus assembly protein TadD
MRTARTILGSTPRRAAQHTLSALRTWSERPALWELAILIVAVGLFAQTVGFGWVYDDEIEIVANTYIRSFSHLPEIFSSTMWMGSGGETHLYRPLPLVTYALNYVVSGLAPWSYHLVNTLLHGLVCVLVFRLARSWRLSTPVAGLGALLFAVHPVHVEVVASVFGRKDLLVAAFTLGMLLSHRLALSPGAGWRTALPVLAYGGALLSKEVGTVGILLVAAQDWAARRGDPASPRWSRRLVGLYLAYLLTLLTYLLVRMAVVGGLGVPDTHFLDNPLVGAPVGQRLTTALVVAAQGVALLAAPLRLSPDYSYNAIPLVQSLLDWRFLGTVALLCFFAWGLTVGRIRASIVPLGVLWYVITLLPGSNLLFPIGTVFGERLLYLPSIGCCIVAALAIGAGATSYRRAAFVAVAALLVTLAAQTVRYSSAWSDNLTLFRWATASVPQSTKAHHKLGEALLRAGQLGPAVRSLRRALEIAPENAFAVETLGATRRRIVQAYAGDSLSNEAAGAIPETDDPDILYVLGQLSRENGALTEAGALWEAAIGIDPTHAESLADLGVLHLVRSDTTRAIDYLERAVLNKPSLASPWFNLGRVSLAQADHDRARSAFQRFVEVAGPEYVSEVAWVRSALEALEAR